MYSLPLVLVLLRITGLVLDLFSQRLRLAIGLGFTTILLNLRIGTRLGLPQPFSGDNSNVTLDRRLRRKKIKGKRFRILLRVYKIEPNGLGTVRLVPLVHSQHYGGLCGQMRTKVNWD